MVEGSTSDSSDGLSGEGDGREAESGAVSGSPTVRRRCVGSARQSSGAVRGGPACCAALRRERNGGAESEGDETDGDAGAPSETTASGRRDALASRMLSWTAGGFIVMSLRRSSAPITEGTRERELARGLARSLSLAALCLVVSGGSGDAAGPAFAASPGSARLPVPETPARFAMTPAARGTLQTLWRSSVRANEEMVACLGGERGEDGVVRITRVQPLAPASADSANASAAPSLATCRPPRWFGTVHTHIITSPEGEPYVDFSSPDRDVMARWEQAWRSQGVFCLLYSGEAAHCVAGDFAAADVSYAPGGGVRVVVSER
jgi:hypothetical protein